MPEPISEYRREYVLTQTNVGATDAVLRLTAPRGGWFDIRSLTTGPDNYAAGRAIVVRVENENGEIVQEYAAVAAIDNNRLQWAPRFPSAAPAADGDMPATGKGWRVHGRDRLVCQASGLAQNETLTVRLRGEGVGILSASSPNAGVTLAAAEE